MKRIGIISDTHSYWDERYRKYLEPCDEIWHCGDFCSTEMAEQLAAIRPLRAVYGNGDGAELRRMFPEVLRFKCEDVEVLMKHIGGYPGRYDRSVTWVMQYKTPDLFISGHSHITKVMFDHRVNCLHINPGAAGLYGQQPVRTLVRFNIDGKNISNLEVIELRNAQTAN